MSIYATGNWHQDAYPQTFRPGEVCRVSCDPITLTQKVDEAYPLSTYHGKRVTVAVEKTRFPRVSWPDDNGVVEVTLPFPYRYKGRVFSTMAILGSLLRKEG